MNLSVTGYCRLLATSAVAGWKRFWFAPADPATLGLIRILGGMMMLYTHLVWTLGLEDFFGAHAWISPQAAAIQFDTPFAWSYFWWIETPAQLWAAHLAALAAFAFLMVGLYSRFAAVASFLAVVSYANRTPGALFGLDQVNGMIALYLSLGPCGDAYSLDRYLEQRAARAGQPDEGRAGGRDRIPWSSGANFAIRLIQVHMCIIYFFAGISKIQGQSWWFGDALWIGLANLEYQSLDMTWLSDHMILVALLTQSTVFWEMMFPAIIWPRLTRPLVLVFAVFLHLGIAICLGLKTFGLAMLIGCSSFLPPEFVRSLFGRSSPTVPNGDFARMSAEPRVKTAPGKQRARR